MNSQRQRSRRGIGFERLGLTLADRSSTSKWTNILVRIRNSPVEARGQSVESCCCVLQICLLPDDASVGTSCSDSYIGIIAIIVTSQAVVVPCSFDDKFQSSIVCPTQAEEPCQEVFGALQHTILSGSPSNDLGTRVIQMAVVIVVQDTRIVEFLSTNRNEDLGAQTI